MDTHPPESAPDLESVPDLTLPPELWLKIAWYILIQLDMDEKRGLYGKYGALDRQRFPIFGLNYCTRTTSALLEIPILGLILRHYMASAGGLTYRELIHAHRKWDDKQYIHILKSISFHESTGRLISFFTSAWICHCDDGSFCVSYKQKVDGFVVLWINVKWRPSGIIISICWHDIRKPDWNAACKPVSRFLPYGMEIRDMTGFLKELMVFVPTVSESGDMVAVPVRCLPDGSTSDYAQYTIVPESVVSRDILRFRPNV
jgi:hypothetical protein